MSVSAFSSVGDVTLTARVAGRIINGMNRVTWLTVSILVLSAPALRAQVIPDTVYATRASGHKSESRAIGLSAAGTFAPWVLVGLTLRADLNIYGSDEVLYGVVLSGPIVGPSLGHYYAERPLRATFGLVVRGAAAAHMVANWNEEAAGLGATILLGSMVLDVITAPLSARRTNQEYAVAFSPFISPGRGRVTVGLWCRF